MSRLWYWWSGACFGSFVRGWVAKEGPDAVGVWLTVLLLAPIVAFVVYLIYRGIRAVVTERA